MTEYVIKTNKRLKCGNMQIITKNDELQTYLKTLFVDVDKIIYEYCMQVHNLICCSASKYIKYFNCTELRISFVICNYFDVELIHNYPLQHREHKNCFETTELTEQILSNIVVVPDNKETITSCNILLLLNEMIKHSCSNNIF